LTQLIIFVQVLVKIFFIVVIYHVVIIETLMRGSGGVSEKRGVCERVRKSCTKKQRGIFVGAILRDLFAAPRGVAHAITAR
ncbi:hypothetical protein, partial [Klebsiella oxytoca]|uniref:hypothetical protein n=1 Tax=Klebsiella oxytoca TaxID=571 RepID=UPI001954B79F